MLFDTFLESVEYLDFIDYLKASRNNRLKYTSSEFDSIYDYYEYLSMNKVLTCKNDANEIYINYEKQQPIMINFCDINNQNSDDNSDSDKSELKNTIDNINNNSESDELNESDELSENNKRQNFTLSSILHPDYPHSSVPFLLRYSRDEIYENEEEYEEYECNDNIEIEDNSSEFNDSDELD